MRPNWDNINKLTPEARANMFRGLFWSTVVCTILQIIREVCYLKEIDSMQDEMHEVTMENIDLKHQIRDLEWETGKFRLDQKLRIN